MKSLERRLASVLTQAFDDCPTLRGRFRLLECFSDLVHRPTIAEELQRKHAIMVQDFAAEVDSVMQVPYDATGSNVLYVFPTLFLIVPGPTTVGHRAETVFFAHSSLVVERLCRDCTSNSRLARSGCSRYKSSDDAVAAVLSVSNYCRGCVWHV